MITSTFSLRIRYADTDQMHYVYYGNYAKFFEIGRVELFRELGVSYKELEDSGVMMPVLELNTKYIKPARYDEMIRIETTLVEIPSGPRIAFDYRILNDEDELLTLGHTKLVFVDIHSGKPVKCPLILQKNAQAFLDKKT